MVLRILLILLIPSMVFAGADQMGPYDLNKCKTMGRQATPVDSIKQIGRTTFSASTTACLLDTENTANHDTTSGLGQYSTQEYKGAIWDDGAISDVCRVDVKIGNPQGDLTVNDYYVEIWLVDGSNELDTFQGRSEKVDGSNAWYWTWVEFTFAADVTLDCTGSNEYAIVIKAIDSGDAASTAGEYDSTNYAAVAWVNDQGSAMTNFSRRGSWAADGSLTNSDYDDWWNVKVYTKQ